MFSVRQLLRFSSHLKHFQCLVYNRSVPIIHNLNGINSLHNNRFIHEECINSKKTNQLKGNYKLVFTCKRCDTRNMKLISKLAYEKGVIIVRCDGCKNNHLIADNLGWFTNIDKGTNIEKIMASKGESVKKIFNDSDGYYEAVTNEEFNLHQKHFNEERNFCNDNECSSNVLISETPTNS